MKITAIKQQVKQQGRYSIFVDGKYSFSLSELGLINSGLRANQELSQSEIDNLKDTSTADKAYNQTLGLLARRPRSRWEVADYLKRKDYSPALVEETINKLSELGYINDLSFAKMWVENRRLLKATSRRRLKLELKQKHVADEIIEIVLAEDKTDEREVLEALVEKKRRLPRYQDDLKLAQFLMRQGYNYEDIKAALKNTSEQI
jgi:regulatory protein